MEREEIKVYSYRWIVLIAFMLINLVIQVQWLTFAPIRSAAMKYYGVSGGYIDFLSLSYMFAYIIFSMPASFVIDTYGIKKGIGIGAAIAGISAIVKGFHGGNFTLVLIGQIGLAIAQPFVLNAITALTVRWFPLKERGTAAGLAALSQYLGIILVMILTPILITTVYSEKVIMQVSGIDSMLKIYGLITVVSAIIAIVFIKEKPETAPSSETEERHNFKEGFKHIFKSRDMLLLILLFFIGLGIFNAVSTMIDAICLSKGLTVDQSGMVGGMMLIGGVIGAVIFPMLSDYLRKRKLIIVICIFGMIPSITGLYFASTYLTANIFSFLLGFFVMSAGPIGFQYAAEISYPARESLSQGVIILAGQISGIIFVAGMGTPAGLKGFMIAFIALSIVGLIITLLMKESPMIITEADKAKGLKTTE